MRTGEPPRSVSGGAKHGVEKSDHAAFTVRPGDVNGGIGILRISGLFEQRNNIVEPELDAVEFEAGEIVAGR